MPQYQNFDQQKLFFCNIQWMRDYQGPEDDLPDTDKLRFEENNFKEQSDGQYHGYVHVPGERASFPKMHIEKLGAQEGAPKVENITVIWTATHIIHGNKVVGWYKKATVYRAAETEEEKKSRIQTKIENGYLIPVENRILSVPSGQAGAPGQSSITYGKTLSGTGIEALLTSLDDLLGNSR